MNQRRKIDIMLNEFVEKILVHERARKGSQDTTQEVEIYFNFVGRYIPPALQPVPLTPEEQEELRKKEERKDRLHQNYLRRKANGKQKEWEERYNAKRKAQREAAKAAIRAEDMEKGIFIPVSQLPRQEPRKATVAGVFGQFRISNGWCRYLLSGSWQIYPAGFSAEWLWLAAPDGSRAVYPGNRYAAARLFSVQ